MQDNLPAHVPLASAPMSPAPVNYYSVEEDQDGHLLDYWHVLKKRKWWVFGVLSGAIVLVLLVIFLMPPIYRVTATLQIIQDNPTALMSSSADLMSVISGSSEMDRFYETQYNILQSPAIAYELIDSLRLQEHPAYKKMEKNYPDDPPAVIRQKYVQDLLDNLKVEQVKNSFLMNVSFSSTDKVLAQKIPEAIQKAFLKLSMTTRQQSYAMLRNWLDGELTRLGEKLEASEQKVYDNGQKRDFLSLEAPETNVTIQKYIEISKLLTTAQADKAGKEAQYRQIQEKGADAPLITNNPLIQQLRQQLISLDAQVNGENKIFGNNFPDLKATRAKLTGLRQHLSQEIKRLEASIRADYEAAARAESLVQKEFDLQKSKVIDLQNDLVQHHILKRDLQTNQTLYEGLLARMKEASVASTMVATNVSVITPAEKPYKPWQPKPMLFLALALITGSIGGVGTAFFVEYLDNSIKTTEELEKTCHIPSLGVVPLITNNAKTLTGNKNDSKSIPLSLHNEPRSILGESIFHIRAAIMLAVSDTPPQVILVTSANPDEGKSTVSQSLAVVFASPDRSCLIMDCDLRKPSLYGLAERSLQPGLTNYLTGTASAEEIIHPSLVPNLYLIPAGPIPPNPNELLSSEKFKNLLKDLRQKYHHILIDSPPIIGFAEGRSIAANTDGVLLMVKHHSTTKEAARLAVQLLSQTNCRILGGTLTMAKKDRLGVSGYYGYYKYYNKYHEKYQT